MAPQWDEMVAGYRRQLRLERAALRTLLDLLDVATGERLLDVATGPAPLLSELSSRERRPATAVGVDTSAAMIALAPPLPSAWRLRVADATDMPFDDGSFDVATASYLLHVLDRDARRVAIAECARVLAPGGRLGTTKIAPPRRSIATAITAPSAPRPSARRGAWPGCGRSTPPRSSRRRASAWSRGDAASAATPPSASSPEGRRGRAGEPFPRGRVRRDRCQP